MIASGAEVEGFISAGGAGVTLRHITPSDKKRQIVIAQEGNLLRLAARIQNEGELVNICKKDIASVTAHNECGDNPFHEAARNGILLPAVKGIVSYLETEANNEIMEAEEAGDRKEVSRLKEEFKCNKKYIKDALCSKDHAFNKKRETPLYYLDAAQQKEIKQIAGIKDSFICNQKFRLCLYIVGAIACIATLCLSLYFLYLSSQTFALNSMATIASSGVKYLSVKACNEIHALVENANVQFVGGGLGVSRS